MVRQVHLFDPPERFVVGTVGQPGERAFFLQARSGSRLISVALEKSQVVVLAERLEELLDAVAARTPGFPGTPDVVVDDIAPLEAPITEEFSVGALGLGWNGETDRLVVEAHAATEGDVEIPDLETGDDDDPDVLRVRVSAVVGRAFILRARNVVSAGRPPCPFCQQPLDPRGHICPRANGYHR
jgi:uncharacterized repeat protein (TIGR03847 family)